MCVVCFVLCAILFQFIFTSAFKMYICSDVRLKKELSFGYSNSVFLPNNCVKSTVTKYKTTKTLTKEILNYEAKFYL